ncbi:heat shock factor family protein ASCRUDRAFT_9044 [Ascoidea rubescens DSM 1968]|uniref:HSF-type DNA-binding domain-containing protein n=1 Tax=Ascoidea rubescens DSM 1968 TaxID=1344418 RepID=A0A1D2VE95_9ASCO|nr:hypothetical protein ASCRUDRAFT_9044 [Ascoidea rubescens DSM 1968]ODV59823.1 hypothetical protein ASCRUDRAFT_9044 [Ascoidea rubescens DSM 1968]
MSNNNIISNNLDNNNNNSNNNNNNNNNRNQTKTGEKKKSAFIYKLHSMLADPQLNHLLWWTRNVEDGTFALCPSSEFADALTSYFNHKNVASFVRQLHMYGFHKVCERTSNNLNSKKKSLSITSANNNNEDNDPSSTNHSNIASNHKNSNNQIWEFRHSSGKFRKDDVESLSQIKRKQPPGSKNSRARSNTDLIILSASSIQQNTNNPLLIQPNLQNQQLYYQSQPTLQQQQQQQLYYQQSQPLVQSNIIPNHSHIYQPQSQHQPQHIPQPPVHPQQLPPPLPPPSQSQIPFNYNDLLPPPPLHLQSSTYQPQEKMIPKSQSLSSKPPVFSQQPQYPIQYQQFQQQQQPPLLLPLPPLPQQQQQQLHYRQPLEQQQSQILTPQHQSQPEYFKSHQPPEFQSPAPAHQVNSVQSQNQQESDPYQYYSQNKSFQLQDHQYNQRNSPSNQLREQTYYSSFPPPPPLATNQPIVDTFHKVRSLSDEIHHEQSFLASDISKFKNEVRHTSTDLVKFANSLPNIEPVVHKSQNDTFNEINSLKQNFNSRASSLGSKLPYDSHYSSSKVLFSQNRAQSYPYQHSTTLNDNKNDGAKIEKPLLEINVQVPQSNELQENDAFKSSSGDEPPPQPIRRARTPTPSPLFFSKPHFRTAKATSKEKSPTFSETSLTRTRFPSILDPLAPAPQNRDLLSIPQNTYHSNLSSSSNLSLSPPVTSTSSPRVSPPKPFLSHRNFSSSNESLNTLKPHSSVSSPYSSRAYQSRDFRVPTSDSHFLRTSNSLPQIKPDNTLSFNSKPDYLNYNKKTLMQLKSDSTLSHEKNPASIINILNTDKDEGFGNLKKRKSSEDINAKEPEKVSYNNPMPTAYDTRQKLSESNINKVISLPPYNLPSQQTQYGRKVTLPSINELNHSLTNDTEGQVRSSLIEIHKKNDGKISSLVSNFTSNSIFSNNSSISSVGSSIGSFSMFTGQDHNKIPFSNQGGSLTRLPPVTNLIFQSNHNEQPEKYDKDANAESARKVPISSIIDSNSEQTHEQDKRRKINE